MSSFRKQGFSIRAEALKKLTQLSMGQESSSVLIPLKSTTDQLSVAYTTDKSKLYTIPLTLSELEILLAVCSSVPATQQQASDLIENVVSHYFSCSQKQKFNDVCKSKFKNGVDSKRSDGKSVYECLSYHLCTFFINVYAKFPSLQTQIEKIFWKHLQDFEFSIYGLCSLLGLINSFISTCNTPQQGKLHNFVLLKLWELSFKNEDQFFYEKINSVINEQHSDDTLVSYFDANYELSSFVFGERIGKLQTLILMNTFQFKNNNYSFMEHLLRLKQKQVLSEGKGNVEYQAFMNTLNNNKEFLLACLDYSLKALEYLQHNNTLELSTYNRVEFAFMSKNSCLQISSLLMFITTSADKDPKIGKIVEYIVEFIHEYTEESYLFYEDFLVSIMAFASLLNYYSERLTTDLLLMFPIFISNKFVSNNLVVRISKNFSRGLTPLTEDTVVSSIYDITNLLGDGSNGYMSILKNRKNTINESINVQYDKLLPGSTETQDLDRGDGGGDDDDYVLVGENKAHGSLKKRSSTLTTLQSMNIFKNLSHSDVLEELSLQSVNGSDSNKDTHDSNGNEIKNINGVVHVKEKTGQWRFWNNVVTALVNVASLYNDQSINVLAITILTQKFRNISEELDSIILTKLSVLVTGIGETEFHLLIKFLQLYEKNGNSKSIISSCFESRCEISKILHNLGLESPLYKIYLKELLENIVSEGDNNQLDSQNNEITSGTDEKNRPNLARTLSRKHQIQRTETEILSSSGRIQLYLKPLSLLLPNLNEPKINYFDELNEELIGLFRDSWFNMVVHGFVFPIEKINSKLYKGKKVHRYDKYLKVFAYNSPPLASNFPKSSKETSFEMNNILRRGTTESNLKVQVNIVQNFYKFDTPLINPGISNQVKVLFLSGSILLELYRCDSQSDDSIANCILYLTDPQVKQNFHKFFESFSLELIKMMWNKSIDFFSKFSLKKLLICTSSRSANVQKQAFECCDLFIKMSPNVLIIDEISIFTMLDLLSTLFKSCIDMKQNTMSPTFQYCLNDTDFISLPMNEIWRIQTLQLMEKFFSKWISKVLTPYQNDVEILLQKYISLKSKRESQSTSSDFYSDEIDYAVSFALNHATAISNKDKPILREIFPKNLYQSLSTSVTKFDSSFKFLSKQSWNSRFWADNIGFFSQEEIVKTRLQMISQLKNQAQGSNTSRENFDYMTLLNLTSNLIILSSKHKSKDNGTLELIHDLFQIIMLQLNNKSGNYSDQMESLSIVKHGVNVWANILKERSELKGLIFSEFIHCWTITMNNEVLPVFSDEFDLIGCEYRVMEYKPSDNENIQSQDKMKMIHFEKIHQIFQFWSLFIKKEYSVELSSPMNNLINAFVQKVSSRGVFSKISMHPYSLKIRLDILEMMITCIELNNKDRLTLSMYSAQLIVNGCEWFSVKNGVYNTSVYGNNEIEMVLLVEQLQSLQKRVTGVFKKVSAFLRNTNELIIFQKIIYLEICKLQNWMNLDSEIDIDLELNESLIRSSFQMDCGLAFKLLEDSNNLEKFDSLITDLIVGTKINHSILNNGDLILLHLIKKTSASKSHLVKSIEEYLLENINFYSKISPVQSINIFREMFRNTRSSVLLNVYNQFNLKSLEQHDSHITFFYIPQIVQCLRYDLFGYVEKFVIDTGKINMYFQHQIIWNMMANMYKDDSGEVPDLELKPKLDALLEKILQSFSKKERLFYDLEFTFFNEITSISGKLKPYIKKSKMEKKLKIDEELSQIEIKPKSYLPSNPDGIIIDIDRLSGKPLQSHAKAPFMATFKILKTVPLSSSSLPGQTKEVIKWQSAIFKVGDDCRQDVLALQLINVCKNIWECNGLDIYVFPYRVIATQAGCGVIDVLPNSISRDMLGREAVNGLYEWFLNKFGTVEDNDESVYGTYSTTMDFEIARLNFIKSLAGYSVISYLLQFKDRHNGNIMYDDMGHILHIDFGFIFDIVPGGVKFEAVPFKLTKEMVQILGGNKDSPYFKKFVRLCCKAFLNLRFNYKFIINSIIPMLDSGLPCFKNKTIINLEKRFYLNKSNYQATKYMENLINKAYESLFTKVYDEFQKITNGIPY